MSWFKESVVLFRMFFKSQFGMYLLAKELFLQYLCGLSPCYAYKLVYICKLEQLKQAVSTQFWFFNFSVVQFKSLQMNLKQRQVLLIQKDKKKYETLIYHCSPTCCAPFFLPLLSPFVPSISSSSPSFSPPSFSLSLAGSM